LTRSNFETDVVQDQGSIIWLPHTKNLDLKTLLKRPVACDLDAIQLSVSTNLNVEVALAAMADVPNAPKILGALNFTLERCMENVSANPNSGASVSSSCECDSTTPEPKVNMRTLSIKVGGICMTVFSIVSKKASEALRVPDT
jgi:hypothetical protein